MLHSFMTVLYILSTEKQPLDEIPAILETKVDTQLSELQELGKDSEITPQRSLIRRKGFTHYIPPPQESLRLTLKKKVNLMSPHQHQHQ